MKKVVAILLWILVAGAGWAQSPIIHGDIPVDTSQFEVVSKKGMTNGYAPLGSNLIINPVFLFTNFSASAENSFWIKSGSSLVPVLGSGADAFGITAGEVRMGRLNANINYFGLEQLNLLKPLYLVAGSNNNNIFFYNNSTIGTASGALNAYTWSISPTGAFSMGGGSSSGDITFLTGGVMAVARVTNANLVINMSSVSPLISFPSGPLTLDAGIGYGAIVPVAPANQTTWALNEVAANIRYGKLGSNNTWPVGQAFPDSIILGYPLPGSSVTGLTAALSSKLSVTGGIMSGPINMTSNQLTGLKAASSSSDAITLDQFIANTISNIIEVGATSPASFVRDSATSAVLTITQASTSANGYISSADWMTFSNKTYFFNTADPVLMNAVVTNGYGIGIVVYMYPSSAYSSGYLLAADWVKFNTGGAFTVDAPLSMANGIMSMPAASAVTNGYLSAASYGLFYTNFTNFASGSWRAYMDTQAFTQIGSIYYMKHSTNCVNVPGGIFSNDFAVLSGKAEAQQQELVRRGQSIYDEQYFYGLNESMSIDLSSITNLYVANLTEYYGGSRFDIPLVNSSPGYPTVPPFIDVIVRNIDILGKYGRESDGITGNVYVVNPIHAQWDWKIRDCYIPPGTTAWFRFMAETNAGSTVIHEIARYMPPGSYMRGFDMGYPGGTVNYFTFFGSNKFYNVPGIDKYQLAVGAPSDVLDTEGTNIVISANEARMPVEAPSLSKNGSMPLYLWNTDSAPGGNWYDDARMQNQSSMMFKFARSNFVSYSSCLSTTDVTFTAYRGLPGLIVFENFNDPYRFVEAYRNEVNSLSDPYLFYEGGSTNAFCHPVGSGTRTFAMYMHMMDSMATNVTFQMPQSWPHGTNSGYRASGEGLMTFFPWIAVSNGPYSNRDTTNFVTSDIFFEFDPSTAQRTLFCSIGSYSAMTFAYNAREGKMMEVSRLEATPPPPLNGGTWDCPNNTTNIVVPFTKPFRKPNGDMVADPYDSMGRNVVKVNLSGAASTNNMQYVSNSPGQRLTLVMTNLTGGAVATVNFTMANGWYAAAGDGTSPSGFPGAGWIYVTNGKCVVMEFMNLGTNYNSFMELSRSIQ